MSADQALSISRAALHELLTDAHVALVEHRPEWAGAVLHTLRKITAPEATQPQGRARKLMDEINLPSGPASGAYTPAPTPPEAGAATQPHAPEPAQAAGGPIIRAIGRKPSGGHHPVSVWTDERTAKLREHWPTCMDDQALLEILNELPGPPVASTAALRTKALRLDIRRTAETLDALAERSGQKGGAASLDAKPAVDQGMRTPERMELLRKLWADPSVSVRQIHARICMLPGPKPQAHKAMYGWAKRIGLPTQRPYAVAMAAAAPAEAPATTAAEAAPHHGAEDQKAATPDAPPPATPPATPAPAAPADEKAEVFDAFASGMTVRDVAAEFGLPLSVLSNWHAEWKLLTKANAA
jgi:hypothetical protein